jgi:hypothetical protein
MFVHSDLNITAFRLKQLAVISEATNRHCPIGIIVGESLQQACGESEMFYVKNLNPDFPLEPSFPRRRESSK